MVNWKASNDVSKGQEATARKATIAPHDLATSTCRAACVTTWIPVRSDGGAPSVSKGWRLNSLTFKRPPTREMRVISLAAWSGIARCPLSDAKRLIAQPEIEINCYSKKDPSRAVGTGLSEIDTALRIRYELSRKFAPYVGVAYNGKFGETAAFARNEGEVANDLRMVFGLRVWY